FAGVTRKQKESEAFKKLSIHAKWLYVEYRFKYNGENDHNIVLTQQEAKEIMAIGTFYKARNLLVEVGFIDVIRRGGLEKQPTIYGLSDRWKKFGTKDFIRIDLKKILPRIFTQRFKKRHKFMGNQFKEKEHL
ncbi:unnamed protein product, partial [marine sediment metagenome]